MDQTRLRGEQEEIFYAILTGYVKQKLGGGEITFELWQEKSGAILEENWLLIKSIYTVSLKMCGLTMVFTPDTMLQGDDAKHMTSYGYSTFLGSDAKQPDELYTNCEKMMRQIILRNEQYEQGKNKQAEEN
jgi:hypothetical protein